MKILNYEKIKEEGLTLLGTVLSAAEDESGEPSSKDVLFIDNPEIIEKVNKKKYMIEAETKPFIVMFRDRIGLIFQKGPLTKYIGNKIAFRVEDISTTEDGEVCVYASLRMILEKRRDKTIALLEKAQKEGTTISAKINRLENTSAYLVTKNNVPLILTQKCFSTDWTPINEVYKAGDIIEVTLDHVSEGKRVFVRLPELYTSKKLTVDEINEKFKPGMSLDAKIMDVQVNCCFVRIAPGLDMLCPIPKNFEPEKGMRVKAKISQIKEAGDKVRIRGKVMGEIDTEKFVLDCIVDNEFDELIPQEE